MIFLRNISAFLLVLFCIACGQQNTKTVSVEPQQPNISANENKGLKKVVAHYGGQGHFFKGTSPATSDTPKKTSFEIELSGSKFVEAQKHLISFHASNMAYLFYKELGEERKNYDEIHSIIILSDGQKTTTKFPASELDVVLQKMKLLDKIVALLKAKDYDTLSGMINNTDLVPYDKSELIENLKAADADYVTIESFKSFGFRRNKTTDGERVLHLSGYLNRSIKNNEFSIDVAMDSDKEEVYLLQYVL